MVLTSHKPCATTFNYSLKQLFIISSNKTALIYAKNTSTDHCRYGPIKYSSMLMISVSNNFFVESKYFTTK